MITCISVIYVVINTNVNVCSNKYVCNFTKHHMHAYIYNTSMNNVMVCVRNVRSDVSDPTSNMDLTIQAHRLMRNVMHASEGSSGCSSKRANIHQKGRILRSKRVDNHLA